MSKSSCVVCVIRATWHTHVLPENFFQTKGGGGLAPESPTGNERASTSDGSSGGSSESPSQPLTKDKLACEV